MTETEGGSEGGKEGQKQREVDGEREGVEGERGRSERRKEEE